MRDRFALFLELLTVRLGMNDRTERTSSETRVDVDPAAGSACPQCGIDLSTLKYPSSHVKLCAHPKTCPRCGVELKTLRRSLAAHQHLRMCGKSSKPSKAAPRVNGNEALAVTNATSVKKVRLRPFHQEPASFAQSSLVSLNLSAARSESTGPLIYVSALAVSPARGGWFSVAVAASTQQNTFPFARSPADHSSTSGGETTMALLSLSTDASQQRVAARQIVACFSAVGHGAFFGVSMLPLAASEDIAVAATLPRIGSLCLAGRRHGQRFSSLWEYPSGSVTPCAITSFTEPVAICGGHFASNKARQGDIAVASFHCAFIHRITVPQTSDAAIVETLAVIPYHQPGAHWLPLAINAPFAREPALDVHVTSLLDGDSSDALLSLKRAQSSHVTRRAAHNSPRSWLDPNSWVETHREVLSGDTVLRMLSPEKNQTREIRRWSASATPTQYVVGKSATNRSLAIVGFPDGSVELLSLGCSATQPVTVVGRAVPTTATPPSPKKHRTEVATCLGCPAGHRDLLSREADDAMCLCDGCGTRATAWCDLCEYAACQGCTDSATAGLSMRPPYECPQDPAPLAGDGADMVCVAAATAVVDGPEGSVFVGAWTQFSKLDTVVVGTWHVPKSS